MTSTLQLFGIASDVLVWQALLLTFLSFVVGILGGFVGLALGSMRLPALLLFGISPPTAAGTNIAISAASALTGALRHLREGRVNMRIALVMGVPSVVGGFLGGFYSRVAPEAVLVTVVALLVGWQGIELVVRSWRRLSASPGAEEHQANPAIGYATLSRDRVIVEGGVGFVIGVLGGAVGLILGSLRLPVLMRLLRLDPRVAAGTNLFIGFMLGSMGWLGHAARGEVDYLLVALMGSTAVAGSYLGARLTGRVSIDKLVMTMGIVLTVVSVLLLWRALHT